ncbi:hypothetical protein Hdeb2414_s0003g00092681 [Helianthus debilis subsp. tardiflorus]
MLIFWVERVHLIKCLPSIYSLGVSTSYDGSRCWSTITRRSKSMAVGSQEMMVICVTLTMLVIKYK